MRKCKCILWKEFYIEELNDCFHYEKEIEIPFIPQIGMTINDMKIVTLNYDTDKEHFYCFSESLNLHYEKELSKFIDDTWILIYKYSELRCK